MSAGESTSKFGYRSGDRIVPGYRLEEMLGGGNFGEVWRAIGPGRVRAAIKILDLSGLPGKVERRALDRIRDIVHPNLVSIFGIWSINRDGGVVNDVTSSASFSAAAATVVFDPSKLEAATRMVIAMQLGGMSLFARLQECQAEGRKGIPCKELLGYVQDAARGIDYLNEAIHDLGDGPVSIVHCDIKPQNLLLVGGGVQVCDYSLIRPVEDVQKTAMGGSCTPAYAAPELHVSKPCVSSDQYCLAMSYVELRTGNLPFPPDTKLTDLFYVKYEKRLDFSGLAPPVVEVLRRATDPDPPSRFASCCEMVEALRQAEELHESKPRWFPPRIKLSSRGWKKIAAGLLTVTVAVAAVLWYLFRPVPPTKIDEWLKADEFPRAFAYTLRAARPTRTPTTASNWFWTNGELASKRWESSTTTPRRSTFSPPFRPRSRTRIPAKTQIEGTRIHAWEQLAEDCTRPESLDAAQIATVLDAKYISDKKKQEARGKLSGELARRYEKALDDSDFTLANRILKSVEQIAKTDKGVYAGLNFDLAAQGARRYEKAFEYYKTEKKFRAAKELLEDPHNTSPNKERDRQELADAWYADLQQRGSSEDGIRADDRLADDVGAFLEFAPRHAGGQDARILQARLRIRDHSYTVVGELQNLEKAAASAPQSLLLLRQLELICRDRETPGETIGQSDGKALLNQIAKLLPPGSNAGPPETQLFSWEKDLYEETKNRLNRIAPPPVEKPVGEAVPQVVAQTPDELLGAAVAALGKGDLETARQKLAEIKKPIEGLSGESANLWRHKLDLWNGMVVLAESRPATAHVPDILIAMKKVPDGQWVRKTVSANQVPLICKELAAVAQCNDAALLDESLALLWNILDSFRIKEKDVLPVLGALFQARIHLLLQAEVPGGAASQEVRERFDKLDGMWQEIKGGMAAGGLVECSAWNVEYRIALKGGDEDTLADALGNGMALPVKSGAYVSVAVRCFASHESHKKTGKLLPSEWIAFLNDLVNVLATKGAHDLTPQRMRLAQQWAAEAVRELCKPTGARGDTDLLRVDFPTGHAGPIHALLKQATADGAKLGDDLQTAWAFAGLYRSPMDFQPAENVLAAIDFNDARADAAKRAREALPLLFTYLDRRLAALALREAGNLPARPGAAEKTTVLRHAIAFLRVFQRSRRGALSESEAKLIAAHILDRAVGLADKIEAGEKGNSSLQAQRADLYEAVFDITDVFSKIPWQDKSLDWADPKSAPALRGGPRFRPRRGPPGPRRQDACPVAVEAGETPHRQFPSRPGRRHSRCPRGHPLRSGPDRRPFCRVRQVALDEGPHHGLRGGQIGGGHGIDQELRRRERSVEARRHRLQG